jgi:uncharacterized protein (DUF4415 family)
MKDNYDFSKARRGAAVKAGGKTRITIMLDDDVLSAFRKQAAAEGKGYQTLINDTLRQALAKDDSQVTTAVLRQVLREELHRVV